MCGIDDMSSQGSWYMECTWGQKHYTICYTIYTIYNNKNSVVTWYSPPDLPPGVSSWGWSVVSLVAADSPWERDCYMIYTIYNNKTVSLRDTVHQISRRESAAAMLTTDRPQPLTPRGRSGGPYHITTQLYFYPMMSKIQNSTNIYLWIWCCLKCPTQDFGNL